MKLLLILSLPFLVAVCLWVSILYRILTRPDFDTNTRLLWAVVVIFVPLIGMVLYWVAAPAAPVTDAPQAPSPPAKGPFAEIPPKNPAIYADARTWESWQNPSLRIRDEGIFVNDSETPTTVEDLLGALAALPGSAWPYGRIVAISAFSGSSSREDAEAHRDVVQRVLEALKSAGLDSDVWPGL